MSVLKYTIPEISAYGNTYFSRKWLSRIPKTILERSPQKSGICRVTLK